MTPDKHEAGKQQNVVDDDRMDAQPEERRAHQRRHEHRVGIRQREALGIKLVRVEQRERIARQLVVDPGESPD